MTTNETSLSRTIAVLGAGKNACNFIRIAKSLSWNCVVVTHPRPGHERDAALYAAPACHGAYESVFDYATDHGVPLLEATNVNDPTVMEWLLSHGAKTAMSFSCRSIIRRAFLNAFEGRVFNFHSAPLPEYRGGAAPSWMILAGEKEAGGVIHYVDEGVDTGDVVARYRAPMPTNPKPIDIIRLNQKYFLGMLKPFLDGLGKDNLSRQPQKEDGSYFPRLKSEVHGAIDWSENAEETARFIRAFSYPYSGAFSTINGVKKVWIMSAETVSGKPHHPFMSGLVLKAEEGRSLVSMREGILAIQEVLEDNQGDRIPARIRQGDRLSTSLEDIAKAKDHRAVY